MSRKSSCRLRPQKSSPDRLKRGILTKFRAANERGSYHLRLHPVLDAPIPAQDAAVWTPGARRSCRVAFCCARISTWQMNLHPRSLMLTNWKLRRLGSPFCIVFASSVTTCSALRRKISTPSSAPTATRAKLALRDSIFIPAACHFVFRSATICAKPMPVLTPRSRPGEHRISKNEMA